MDYLVNLMWTLGRPGQDLASLDSFDDLRVLGSSVRHFAASEDLPTENAESPNIGLRRKSETKNIY